MTGEELRKYYVMFGEDPFITDLRRTSKGDATDDAGNHADAKEHPGVLFSAWDFASRMAHVVVAMKLASGRFKSDKENLC